MMKSLETVRMYPALAVEYLKVERECVSRECDRNCASCDLAQDRDTLLSAIDCAVDFMEKQVKLYLPRLEWHRSLHKWLYYCGNCGRGILRIPSKEGDGGEYCVNCGMRIDWKVWTNEQHYFRQQQKWRCENDQK